ncbi:MAG: hypothetical protein RIR70_87 [Pseudomonadota bacterium]|jgi:DNA-binding transcriptional MerR regulator/methylmalonyl-CoA mutase cobalamin-binding subunit
MPKDKPTQPHLPIGAVERDTGLPKDTLRVWERRYGFPNPARDALGERLYSPEDVEKLRLIKRLLDQGHRPSKLITADASTLAALIEAHRPSPEAPHCEALLALVRVTRADELRAALGQTLLQQGLVRFICDTLTPLTRMVGEAWVRGEVQVVDEHLYSELVENILRAAIGAHLGRGNSPRILLTTVPDEEHGLGLLMAEAMMTAEGALCTSLGTRTPLNDIQRAASEGRFDVVALSYSARCSVRTVTDSLNTLRQGLPQQIALWAGGAGLRATDKLAAGILPILQIADVPQCVRDWRTQHGKRT